MSRERSGGLLAYATAATVARSATEGIYPAVSLVTVATGGSPSKGAFLLSCYVFAGAGSGPFVGRAVDRTTRPKRALSAAMVGCAVALTCLAIGIGRIPFWVLALAAACAGLAQPVPTAGWTAQLPRVVSHDRLGGAYGIDAATYSIGQIAGPALVGVALSIAARAPLLVPITLLLLASVVLFAVPIAEPKVAPSAAATSLRRGFTVMWENKPLLRSSIVATVGFAGQAAFIAAAPVVSRHVGAGLHLVGPQLVAMAVGGLSSTLYLARHPVRSPDRWMDIGTVVVALGLLTIAVAGSAAVVLLGGLLIGLGDGPMFTATLRIRSREAPPEVRGQVFATAASLRMGSYAVMLAAFGVLLAVGAAAVLFAGAVMQALAIGLGAWSAVGHGVRVWRPDPAG